MSPPSEPWAFDPARAALLVIDMQHDFVDEGAVLEVAMARRFIPAMARLIEAARRAGVPVVYTQHTLFDGFDVSPLETAYQPALRECGIRHGTPGVAIIPELAPRPGETVIVKHRYDAFHNTRLETVLRTIRGSGVVDTVIIIGTVTNICCESTARSAFMRDYKVVFVSDANGGLDEASQQATLATIGRCFGRVLSADEVLAGLAGHAQGVEVRASRERASSHDAAGRDAYRNAPGSRLGNDGSPAPRLG